RNLAREDYRTRLNDVLDHFQWAYPDRGQNRGEVTVDPDDDDTLLLTVWCQDNANPDSDDLGMLEVRRPIDFYDSPENNIRYLIHGFLTHEADEQMFFGPQAECLFYPHED